jgi:hypothetical protein
MPLCGHACKRRHQGCWASPSAPPIPTSSLPSSLPHLLGCSASFASVESVKAASDVYLPVGGTIVEVNKALVNDPGAVNKSAESSAWFAKIKVADAKEVQGLLDAAQYKAACDAEKH